MRSASQLAVLASLLLAGCPADLSQYTVVRGGSDGGNDPARDAGHTPVSFGTPCPNPHLLVSTIGGDPSRVIRFDASMHSQCRASELLEVQRAFGTSIPSVEWHASVGEILGLESAVLALDDEGFPAWRYDPFDSEPFHGEWIAVLGEGQGLRIAIGWSERSSSLDAMLLLDAQGNPRSARITPPFFGFALAPHPDGSGALLIPAAHGADIDVYTVSDASTMVHEDTAMPLWGTAAPDLPDVYGGRVDVTADLESARLVIAHEHGIAHWRVGTAAPSEAYDCPSLCSTFHAAAPDPNDGESAFAICGGTSGSRHLVHVTPTGCSMVLDGTGLSPRTLQDVALVRAPL
jgi:hypothetical protein